MKKIIKYQLLIEGRLEDVKAQYPQIPSKVIDLLAKNDPSGNNKYLPWMTRMLSVYYSSAAMQWQQKDALGSYSKGEIVPGSPAYERMQMERREYTKKIIDAVHKFHQNVNRFAPARVYEAITNTWGHIPREMAIIRNQGSTGTKLGIHSCSDINIYPSVEMITDMITYLNKIYPSKSELEMIRQKESVNIYEDEYIKVVAPQSHRASCMYGANTKWCTTTAHSDSNFKSYTQKNDFLIYFLFKQPYEDITSGRNKHEIKKIALQGETDSNQFLWYNEEDHQFDGLPVLQRYLQTVTSQDNASLFNTVKDRINTYIKTQDKRFALTKFLKPKNL